VLSAASFSDKTGTVAILEVALQASTLKGSVRLNCQGSVSIEQQHSASTNLNMFAENNQARGGSSSLDWPDEGINQ
jgi:hypothetical protein